jgi:DNA-binding winged helix-turn-helix (wHTH) protein/tetratricopeptide (TPR) repeat protein
MATSREIVSRAARARPERFAKIRLNHMTGTELYRFGEFTLDVADRRLWHGTDTVPLTPKAHDLLVALVRSAGRLVTKRDLLDVVWPDSFVEEGILSVHVSALRKALRHANGSMVYIETVPRSGYRFVAPVAEQPMHDLRCRAVLPAQPIVPADTPADRAIGLAIADSLITALGAWGQVVVRPLRAVQDHANIPAEQTGEIARSLEVDAIVLSRFARTGASLDVSAQLIRASDGACLWSGRVGETPGPGLPRAIARSLAERRSIDPRVYELIGRGRQRLLTASIREVPQAIADYRAALELDNTYAAAHAGLALAHCAAVEARAESPADGYREARGSALRALAMDGQCADAQVALGAVLFLGEWDWAAAERCLARALDLNPNHTEAYLLYGRLLEAVGRVDDGLAMKLRALERDPSSPLVHLQIAMSYWHLRRYDAAIEWANRTLALDPRHLGAREQIAAAYLKKGDVDRHMEENIRHAESYGVSAEALAPLKEAYANGGRPGVVRYVLEQSRAGAQAPAMQLALFNGEAGDLDAAFLHLNRAIDSRDPCLVHLAVAPQWDDLRADPRFAGCLTRMGLGNGAMGQ